MAALVSYEQAVHHLKQQGVLDVSPDDADLTLKIKQASAIVVGFLKRPGEWDGSEDPDDDLEFAVVQAAVLKVLGNLYRFRGDDESMPSPISPDVELMLAPYRVPTLA